ncbi:hypothetical protein ABBQ32_007883 [Trebouxia sp. C0010 RCD-2024]
MEATVAISVRTQGDCKSRTFGGAPTNGLCGTLNAFAHQGHCERTFISKDLQFFGALCLPPKSFWYTGMAQLVPFKPGPAFQHHRMECHHASPSGSGPTCIHRPGHKETSCFSP